MIMKEKDPRFSQTSLICYPDPHLPPEPQDREELEKGFSWRIFRIMAEFVEGFQVVLKIKKGVAVFGGTKIERGSHFYQEAEKLGRALAKHGFTVITGGGPGIMEAANKGAFEAGGESIGLNIELSVGERKNDFLTHSLRFNYFFTRKTIFSLSAKVYVFFPGGFGTLDEFFEMIALLQTGKLSKRKHKIVLIGEEYWGPLVAWINKDLARTWKTIKEEDVGLMELVKDADQAFIVIKKWFGQR